MIQPFLAAAAEVEIGIVVKNSHPKSVLHP